jgi:hypothetical protein
MANAGFTIRSGNVADAEYVIVVRPSDGAEICTAERTPSGKFRNVEFTRAEYLKSNATRQAAMRCLQSIER